MSEATFVSWDDSLASDDAHTPVGAITQLPSTAIRIMIYVNNPVDCGVARGSAARICVENNMAFVLTVKTAKGLLECIGESCDLPLPSVEALQAFAYEQRHDLNNGDLGENLDPTASNVAGQEGYIGTDAQDLDIND